MLSVETHEAVFTWVLQQRADAGLVRGRTVGIDATTLEANAALRSIVRRETGEDDTTFLTRLAEASGMATSTRAELARFDRSRTKKTSNAEWTHPHDPDARVTKMQDGRTHLAHKAEHTVDLETGAVVGVTVQGADTGDTASMVETLIAAAEQVDAVLPDRPGIEEERPRRCAPARPRQGRGPDRERLPGAALLRAAPQQPVRHPRQPGQPGEPAQPPGAVLLRRGLGLLRGDEAPRQAGRGGHLHPQRVRPAPAGEHEPGHRPRDRPTSPSSSAAASRGANTARLPA